MGAHDLPDMYTFSRRALSIQIKQVRHAHITTVTNKAPTDKLLRTQTDRWMLLLTNTRNKKRRCGNEETTSA